MIRTRARRLATFGTVLGLSSGLVLTGLAAGTAQAGGVPGVTATSITIGATVPLTGIASPGYNEVAKAARAVFDYVNSKGGVNHRHINFVLKDDCYGTPAFGCTGTPNTAQQTNALLALPVFATVGSLGTPTQDSVRALLKANHTPQLFVNSGSKDWNNAATYPQLFGWQPSYTVESKILAHYILSAPSFKTSGKLDKVCFLGQNDDFGTDGRIGLGYGKLPVAVTSYYSVTSLVLLGSNYFKSFIHTFQTDGCKVIFLDTIPGATAAAFKNAHTLGYKPHWVISSVGSDPITVHNVLGKSISPDPEIGATSFSPLPVSTVKTPWKAWITKVLLKDKTDFPTFKSTTPLDGNMVYGASWGVLFAEVLYASGKNFTQNSFVNTILTHQFPDTPSLIPLQYTASNHQGQVGGLVDTIKSATQTTIVGKGIVYRTDSSSANNVVVSGSKPAGGPIPPWLS
jgi:ABC-type branched-subunit amino acid transport system substrate-binding protein